MLVYHDGRNKCNFCKDTLKKSIKTLQRFADSVNVLRNLKTKLNKEFKDL